MIFEWISLECCNLGRWKRALCWTRARAPRSANSCAIETVNAITEKVRFKTIDSINCLLPENLRIHNKVAMIGHCFVDSKLRQKINNKLNELELHLTYFIWIQIQSIKCYILVIWRMKISNLFLFFHFIYAHRQFDPYWKRNRNSTTFRFS